MDAPFSALLSGLDRVAFPDEDLDANVTQMIGGDGSVALAAARSRVGSSDRTRDSSAALRRGFEMPHAMGGHEILRQLGCGGMGVVYEARHGATGEHVALKTIGPHSPGADESLRREIQALRRIDHPGVVRLRTVGAHRGVPFYTMDLLPSLSLAGRHPVQRGRGSTLAHKRLLTILRRIASSIAAVHAKGIVHRDLNPNNILLRRPDQPVLIDFGLAYFPAAARRERRSVGGRAMGTLAYMAPEQIRGQLVDARTDLYALGCILYEALTGRVPFTGNCRHAILRQHLEAAPCPPSLLAAGVPPALDRLSLRLLAKAPAERGEGAAEVAALLGSLGAADWNDTPAKVTRRLSATRR